MKFENLMMKSLFAAALLLCALTLGAMVTAKPVVSDVATHAQTTQPAG